MSSTPSTNVVIAQSGGPTAVINQSLAGCMEGWRASRGFSARIYGARHGVRGLMRDDLVDLTDMAPETLEAVARTPSAALGSTRDKPDESNCARILETLRKRNIGWFFYVGGNDSSDTCRIVRDMAAREGYDLRAFHVPKTIDNDLVCNDHTPGFGSAARFVATAFMSDDLDNRALPGVKINIVMGRNAGFLTAAAALGRTRDDDGPHLIYVPERPFDVERFIADVERHYARLGRCLVAVSEGIRDASGRLISATLGQQRDTDAHGNLQLSGTGSLGDYLSECVKKGLRARHAKLRVRADTFGYLQRSSFDISPVDAREARSVGRFAAERALDSDRTADAHGSGGSITIERVSNTPYSIRHGLVPLEDVAARTRTLDHRFLAGAESHVTDAFIDYARPLIGPLPVTARL